jgi:tetratricopeptide (TPR) repeat protein
MPPISSGPSRPQEEASPHRLDSWKEIAAYLGKGERTAKRWETERALPVHRVPGGGRGSVYAFAAELDEWLISAKPEEGSNGAALDFASEAGQAAGSIPGPTFSLQALSPRSEDLAVSPPPVIESPGRASGRWRTPLSFTLLAIVVLSTYFFIHHRNAGAPPASINFAAPTSSAVEKQLAHELYLRGRYEWSKRTPDSLDRALDDFTQAVVHDPASAPAYVGMADTYDLLREYSLMSGNEAYRRAIVASRRAVELDDSLAEAHRSLAFDEFWGSWDFLAAGKEFRRAIELNPRDPLAHLWFANAFSGPGWYPLCLHEMDRAQELDPSSRVILADKGQMLLNSGQTEQGVELLKQIERTDPDFLPPHRFLAILYFARRDYPNFLIENQKAAELARDPLLEAATAAAREGFQHDGERGLLDRLYAIQKTTYADGKIPGVYLARTCVRLGKKDEALELLRAEYQSHGSEFLLIRADLVLTELKAEPGYQQLIGDLHFPAPDAAALRSQDSAPSPPQPK